MTEQHTSFGGLAVADPRSATSTVDVDTTDNDNKRKLTIVGAVVAVVVVLIAAFFLLKGNGSSDSGAATPPHVVPPASSSTTHAAAAAKPAKAVHLPKSYNGVVGRDPFKALYVQPVDKANGGAPGSTTTTSNGTTSTTTTTTGGTSTGTTTTTPTGTVTVPTSPVSRPVWIRLDKLTANSARFAVGFSDHKNLKVRDFTVGRPSPSSPKVFARNFALLQLTSSHVVVQFGDGTPFTLDLKHSLMIVN